MKFFLLFLVAFTSLNSNAQNSFEGVITYSIQATSTNEKISNEDLEKIYGNEMKASYKNGFTKTEKEKGNGEWEVYVSSENKQYLRMRNSEKTTVYDGADETRKLASFDDQPSDLVVLGKKTRLLTIQYEDRSVSKYWYSPDIYIDPKQFKELKFAFLNKYWEVARAPYLKHERIHPTYKVVYLAQLMEVKQISIETFSVL